MGDHGVGHTAFKRINKFNDDKTEQVWELFREEFARASVAEDGNAVQAAGDSFAAPAFTPSGCPYPSALSFFRDLAHTGDAAPLSAGRDIQKFDSEVATWATPTHTSFMVHAAAAAAARGAAKAIKQYCVRRLVDDYIVRAVDAAPALVPRPSGE